MTIPRLGDRWTQQRSLIRVVGPDKPHAPATAFRPDGDGRMRDALLAAMDVMPVDRHVEYALAFCLRGLESIARTAITPAQKNFAMAHIDVFAEYVPADIHEALRRAAKDADDA